MKKLIESVEGLNECPPGMPMEQHEGNPVTMNVSLTASGKEHVADLINMMKNAGMEAAHEPEMAVMPARLDMERLRNIVDEPETPCGGEGWTNSPEESISPIEDVTTNAGGGLNGPKHPTDIRVKDAPAYNEEEIEEWDNEPDEEYKDDDYMKNDLAGGLNRRKKQYKAAQPGDNAIAMETIKNELQKALTEKMKDKEVQEDDDPCWDGYEMIGMKKKGGKEVPNCVPKKKK